MLSRIFDPSATFYDAAGVWKFRKSAEMVTCQSRAGSLEPLGIQKVQDTFGFCENSSPVFQKHFAMIRFLIWQGECSKSSNQ